MWMKEQKVKRGAFEDIDPVPYRKPAKIKTPKKADHKHDYEPVLLEYWNNYFDFSSEKGFIGGIDHTVGSRCRICGHLRLGLSKNFHWIDYRNLLFGNKESKKPATDLPVVKVSNIWNLR